MEAYGLSDQDQTREKVGTREIVAHGFRKIVAHGFREIVVVRLSSPDQIASIFCGKFSIKTVFFLLVK